MNQGRFRWKPILLLAVGFAVFGSGWYLLHRFQMQSLHVRYREQAARAEETGNPDRAVRFLRQYLLVKGDDTDARARFAVLVEKMCRARKHYLTLSGIYERVLREDESRQDIRLARRSSTAFFVELTRQSNTWVSFRKRGRTMRTCSF